MEVHVVLQNFVDGVLELPGSAEDGLAVRWVEFHLTDGIQQCTNNLWDLVYGATIQGIKNTKCFGGEGTIGLITRVIDCFFRVE